ncbi:hypothetical protein BO86DRAFT_399820 [Aspergillus japonicus CBS 114.51]|uniref:Uncharacterized protein n=1 Tax=Aspergillus japonicus CBS 114.51 TaxID=1448312 RepID=A0A8T8X0M7_ASPJA|nr:hypothetical protein BO86DRAFT_399820 [Aspergillus japonicus CBS 114.51]RAH81687.1 hypothetical protein BO86DRAFT_399820 [Aspergillus japonicus CBS 114.51]
MVIAYELNTALSRDPVIVVTVFGALATLPPRCAFKPCAYAKSSLARRNLCSGARVGNHLCEPAAPQVRPIRIFSTKDKKYEVSDGQTFERLPEQGGIYSLNQIDHEPTQTKVSTGSSSRKGLRKSVDLLVSTTQTTDEDQQGLAVYEAQHGIDIIEEIDIEHRSVRG